MANKTAGKWHTTKSGSRLYVRTGESIQKAVARYRRGG